MDGRWVAPWSRAVGGAMVTGGVGVEMVAFVGVCWRRWAVSGWLAAVSGHVGVVMLKAWS